MISREFLDSVRCTEDIVYKTSGGHRLLLDLYGPDRHTIYRTARDFLLRHVRQ